MEVWYKRDGKLVTKA